MVEVLFKVLFVSSIAYGPIILLLLMWNNETPTPLTKKIDRDWETTPCILKNLYKTTIRGSRISHLTTRNAG